MTPEFVYKHWCSEAKKRGGNVSVKWFTPQGKREFLSQPEVHELATFKRRTIEDALESCPKIGDALAHARTIASQQSKKSDAPSLQNPPAVNLKPNGKKNSKPSQSSWRKPKTTGAISSNTDPYTSAERGHQPHSRSTPTFSKAICPSCGRIEDGCPCSR